MKQFKTILSYEFSGYLRSKAFRISTIVVAAVILLALTVPPLVSGFFGDGSSKPAPSPEKAPRILVVDAGDLLGDLSLLSPGFPDYKLEKAGGAPDEGALKKKIGDGDDEYKAVLIVRSALKYTLIEKGPSTSELAGRFGALLQVMRQQSAMADAGMSAQEIEDAFKQVEIKTEATGRGFWEGYSQTYVMLMMLYMSTILYGQFVASSVANEKNSRAMELLITSAKTENLMFGKIIGIGSAGLLQLVIWIAAIVGGYLLNRDFWSGIPVLSEALDMSPQTIFFTLLFYIIGFFMYASMYGAIGSLVSRTEDINTVSTPVVLLVVASFLAAMAAISTPDALYVKILSLVPFTAPMVMFVRISMSEVHPLIIALSVLLSVGATALIALLSASIYRIGVLMYGKPPSVKELFRALKGRRKY